MLIITLTMIFNLINKMEYVPLNFRRGIKVPLFKCRNLYSTGTNNYRGITLLSIFSKIYVMIISERLSPWWKENEAVSYTNSKERAAKVSPMCTPPCFCKKPWRAPWKIIVRCLYLTLTYQSVDKWAPL